MFQYMVESPCDNNCNLCEDKDKINKIDEIDEEFCLSCGRKLSEIVNWTELSEDEKREIISRICESDYVNYP